MARGAVYDLTQGKLPENKEELNALIKKELPLLFVKMNSAQDRFIRVKNSKGRTPKRRIFEGGNKIGKTMIGLMENLAHLQGFRPWLLPEDPDYKIDIKVPNVGMIGCETYKHSVAEKIEPMLRWLTPPTCQPVFKPGPTGVLNVLTLPFDCKGGKCGSKLYIRSYDEQPESFEGIDFDFIHWDEPPPRAIYLAAERGKVVTNAPSWFTMTPLKEPWIFDDLSQRAAIHA
jgi:phage terminase large subunit-like protein